jgi:hypothetical protein
MTHSELILKKFELQAMQPSTNNNNVSLTTPTPTTTGRQTDTQCHTRTPDEPPTLTAHIRRTKVQDLH